MEYMNIRLQIFFFSCDEIRAVVKPGEKFFGSFTIKIKSRKGSGVFVFFGCTRGM